MQTKNVLLITCEKNFPQDKESIGVLRCPEALVVLQTAQRQLQAELLCVSLHLYLITFK